jgi:hypothetical protein
VAVLLVAFAEEDGDELWAGHPGVREVEGEESRHAHDDDHLDDGEFAWKRG